MGGQIFCSPSVGVYQNIEEIQRATQRSRGRVDILINTRDIVHRQRAYIHVRQYSLTSILEDQNTDAQEHKRTQQSSYHDIDTFSEVAKTRLHDFSRLSTNNESLNAKFDELLIHITELKSINFKYSVMCLQETCLCEMDDMSIFNIDGYDRISRGKSCGNKGG